MSQTSPTSSARSLPNGARFYRCALQVNPFAYVIRQKQKTDFRSEADYNNALIVTCVETGIEIIGVTDHYQIGPSRGLIHAARQAGLWVFSGFEAVTKDGVHFLCLFDCGADDRYISKVDRCIGECGVRDMDQTSPLGKWYSLELLAKAKEWGAAFIAAHLTHKGGLLTTLSGQSRADIWKSPDLLAGALPGSIDEAPERFRGILKNTDPAHRRDRPLAIVNASDVSNPEHLKKDSASCFLKMSQVSVEALRQAFLDPESRIRLHSDPTPEPHAQFQAMAWEGGFLDGTAVHFNPNLNVLIGGRGTGKSTVIESLRYVLDLDPIGEDARRAHTGMAQNVLRSGTKVSLRVRSPGPVERCYVIERTVPNPPVVKDDTGQVLSVSPRDVMPGVELFGQHEIAELAKSRDKLTVLLERFVTHDPQRASRKSALRLALERSRRRIVESRSEINALDERLAALPGLEETLKSYEPSGLEERLKEKSRLVREERWFSDVEERLEPVRAHHRDLSEALPIDTAFALGKAIEGLPNADILAEIEPLLGSLSARLADVRDQLGAVLAEADRAMADVKTRWNERRTVIEQVYERLLRELQRSNIDGEAFIRLRRQIEALQPLKQKRHTLQRDLAVQETERQTLLAEWEDVKAEEFRGLASAARTITKRLCNRIRVGVAKDGNRDPLKKLLREAGGNLAATLERIADLDALSLSDLAQHCREGKEALMRVYDLPAGGADRIARAGLDLFMRMEELELPATTRLELNTVADGDPPAWRALEELSTGQKRRPSCCCCCC